MKDKEENTNQQTDAALSLTGAAATAYFAPLTLPALPTIFMVTAGAVIVYGGARATRGFLSRIGRSHTGGKRERQETQQEKDEVARERTPNHQYFEAEDNQDQLPQVAQADQGGVEDTLLTDKNIFIKEFADRACNNLNSLKKRRLTGFLNLNFNKRTGEILQHMLKLKYNSHDEAKKVAKLFLKLQEGQITEADLSDDEKELLKISEPLRLLLKGGADMPWWNHDNDDDSDPDASASEINNDEDDDSDSGAGVCYIEHKTEDNDKDSDNTIPDILDIDPDNQLMPTNTNTQNISYETHISEKNTINRTTTITGINKPHVITDSIDDLIKPTITPTMISETVTVGHSPLPIASEG